MNLPLRVENPSVGEQSHEFVRRGDGVQVGLAAVVNVGVGLPDFPQHLYTQGQILLPGKRQATIDPRLPEVTVHRIALKGAGFMLMFTMQ